VEIRITIFPAFALRLVITIQTLLYDKAIFFHLHLFLVAIRARNSTRKTLSIQDLAAVEHYKGVRVMAIQIQSPRDLFLYDLCAMYDIEQQMVRMLPVLAQECLDNQARQAFILHEQETRQHIRNLEQCFQMLGSQPMGIENHTAAGLKQDHDYFLQQRPPVEAVSMFVIHCGYQSECLEIAAYHDLIDKANSLGLLDCVQLLQLNLQQEVNTSTTLAAIAHQLGQLQTQAVQRPVANAPMPNQSYAPPNQPMPNQVSGIANPLITNQPNVATSPQTPNQSSSVANQQMQDQASMRGNSSITSQVQEGMQVVGSDKSNIGRVGDIRENDFHVDIPLHRDLYVPFSAIQNIDNDRVVLNVAGDKIFDMGWPKPPLA
jgi:ferritin-like metal-binding protein YciE